MNIDTYQKNGWIKIRSFIKPYEIKEIRNKIDNFLKKKMTSTMLGSLTL